MVLGDTGLREERDEGLVGGLDEHELEGVAVEGDALEGAQDRVKDSATSNCMGALRPSLSRLCDDRHLLLPTPLMSFSEKTPVSW